MTKGGVFLQQTLHFILVLNREKYEVFLHAGCKPSSEFCSQWQLP